MTTARFLIGDVFDVMATLPDQSVDLVLTSPPFLALRSYLPPDHPDKAREIGSEPDPATFLDTLLRLTAEWGRLLTPHGSIAVELGDTYSGSGGAGGDYNPGGLRDGQGKFDGSNSRRGRVVDHDSGRRNPGPGWPLDKSLCFIPQLYGASLAYGRNLLTGEPSPAGMWRARNVVAWCRPNPPVGALGDKFRPATSYMTIATRARDRWFDLDAVRTPLQEGVTPAPSSRGATEFERDAAKQHKGTVGMDRHPNGAPPLDWWEIATEPYKGSHYATWPRLLLDRPIKSMCPLEVCTVCGEPRRRIVGEAEYVSGGKVVEPHVWQSGIDSAGAHSNKKDGATTRVAPTLGWTDCGHGTYRPGVVLDPFGGSGTTGAVATGLGRDCILIDLDERNAELAVERIGMFCTVEDTRTKEHV